MPSTQLYLTTASAAGSDTVTLIRLKPASTVPAPLRNIAGARLTAKTVLSPNCALSSNRSGRDRKWPSTARVRDEVRHVVEVEETRHPLQRLAVGRGGYS